MTKFFLSCGLAWDPSLSFAGVVVTPTAVESGNGNGSVAVIGVLLILGLVALTGGFNPQAGKPDTATQDDNDDVIMKF